MNSPSAVVGDIRLIIKLISITRPNVATNMTIKPTVL